MKRKRKYHRPRDRTSEGEWMPARRNRPRAVQLLLLVIVVATAAIAFELYRRAGKRADGRIPVAATDVQPGAPPVDPASVLQLPRVLPQTVKEYQEELRAIKRHLLASIPDRPEVYVQVAMIYLDLGQDQKALETWRHVLKLVANVALAHLGIGTILADRGENENAIGPLRKAVELQPELAIASQLLTEVLLRQGDAEAALKVARDAVKRAPEVCENQFWMGQCYLQLKKYPQARRCHEEAIRLDPNWTRSYYALAVACARSGETEAAAKYRQQFAVLKARDMQKDRDQTRAYDDLAEWRKIVVKRHFVAGSLQLKYGELPLAEAHWLRAAAIDPNDTTPRKALVALFQTQARVAAALQVLAELIRLEPDNPTPAIQRGWLLSLRGKSREAESILTDATRRWPDAAEAHLRLAQSYLRSNTDLAAAEEHAAKAVSLSQSSGSMQLLAAVRAQRGDMPGARAVLQQALKIDPGNQDMRNAYEQLSGTH